jgi:hypothetical protein
MKEGRRREKMKMKKGRKEDEGRTVQEGRTEGRQAGRQEGGMEGRKEGRKEGKKEEEEGPVR